MGAPGGGCARVPCAAAQRWVISWPVPGQMQDNLHNIENMHLLVELHFYQMFCSKRTSWLSVGLRPFNLVLC